MIDFNPTFSDQINSLIEENVPEQNTRDYLGASLLGDSCSRKLQYHLTQTPKDKEYSSRTLRIFDAGHSFETLGIKWMRLAGFELLTEDDSGRQFGFSQANGAIKGHIDGIIKSAPIGIDLSCPCLWECKSMNNKSWYDTKIKGVVVSKPIYASQIALYQAYMGLHEHPALFMAINKDTSELYFELVPFDCATAQELTNKAVNIIEDTQSGHLSPKVSEDPEYFHCRFCEYKQRCWNEYT
ncbi:MAG: hypothetical protein C4617_05105 [Candidatus Liberibacter europaeus]|uniref:Uncharacterized protein n=1 Tax=Candidatus Liberibacter europaeus TaxID=744859 RepID=A0A2T4VWK2_9HYPH|nr:hypothetical protein [Candidatus Liberibacter europaeus]PTL86146.1 MAG: hypothetical protein C4617_05105 [Candidatus Liberibacter europaeus]